jgi:hypothetical protein
MVRRIEMTPTPVFDAPKFEGIEGKDVTIAVIFDLGWEQYRPYAISLVRSGFAGMKIIVVDQSTRIEVREGFANLGFTIVDRVTPTTRTGQWDEWGWQRFYFAAAILRKNPEFRYAIWTDARDVVFQVNPSIWLEQNLSPHQFVIEGLGHAIKDCHVCNDPWLRAVCTEEEWQRVRDFETVTTGVFAGTSQVMQSLFDDIYSGCQTKSHPETTDQGLLNWLVRTPPYDALVGVPRPREGFSTVDFIRPLDGRGPVDGVPVMDGTGVLRTEAGLPIAIVHLYDRIPAWLESMRKKYS